MSAGAAAGHPSAPFPSRAPHSQPDETWPL